MADISVPRVASRSEWLGARAALAGRRSGRFAVGAAATFVVLLIVFLLVPRSRSTPPGASAAAAPPDTVQLSVRAESAHRASARADSQFAAVAAAAASRNGGAPPAGATTTQRRTRDSLQLMVTDLDTLIARAANAPLPASYRSLAGAIALHGDSRMGRLTDSLDALERRRSALAPAGGTDAPYAALTTSMNAVALAIHDAAARRRATLAHGVSQIDSAAHGGTLAIDTTGARMTRDSARASAVAIDSTLRSAREQSLAPVRSDEAANDRAGRRPPPVAMLFAALVLAVIAGFTFNLSAELRNPTLATPREGERVAQAPVLAVARDADRVPRAGGIDPFRMLYLGLTATGTRTRTVIVGGDDRSVVATVAGRLALAAAADARATLVADADPEGSSVAAYYGERPEPGLSDALAGVRLLREITRPIGASDGVTIDVMPGGAIRAEERDHAARTSAREEFTRFRSDYDFCVIVAPTEPALALAFSLTEQPVTVLCAEIGGTALARLETDARRIRERGSALHGLAIWDTELPRLAPRSELMTKTMAARARRPTPEGQ